MARQTATSRYVLPDYWSRDPASLLNELGSTPDGLGQAAASERLDQAGPNLIRPHRRETALRSYLSQLMSPLVLILVFAALVSAIASEWTDTIIVITIVLASSTLGFIQEYSAGKAVEKLRAQVTIKASVLRDGQPALIRSDEIVPGDVVLLAAGSLIPADGVVLEANHFFVNQGIFTGESFPVEKRAGPVAVQADLPGRTNVVLTGTNVRSGTARVLIVQTGPGTEFGRIAERLTLRPPMTEFEHGIHQFGNLLTRIMLVLVALVYVINTILARPAIDSLLFAIALAVGLAPELLPAIISISLAKGAQDMARCGVIVRRLNSIENLGSMDTLCTDKTGTITEGIVHLEGAYDWHGQPSPVTLQWAYLNAALQTGLSNPLDEAILARSLQNPGQDSQSSEDRAPGTSLPGDQRPEVRITDAHIPGTRAPGDQRCANRLLAGQPFPDLAAFTKLGEIPYDFVRKRLSVVVATDSDPQSSPLLITKGALENILAVCNYVNIDYGHNGDIFTGNTEPLGPAHKAAIEAHYTTWSEQGYRVLGVAVRRIARRAAYAVETDECAMIFMGFLLFFDPPRADARQTIDALAQQGVQVKIITGDNHLVARHVAQTLGLPADSILPASQLHELNDEALWHLAERISIFAEVDPNQKERIILALRKMGHVVGYMGDGINDAPALHAADIGISVDHAVDVAKEAADFVLQRHDLGVLLAGIREGRRTFANTTKYIFTTTSANFGNMVSMAGASLFLPFLPLLAKQILLNNFLSDFPAVGISSDRVDDEMIRRPRKWNIRFIRNFMIIFGLVSSIFDYATFGLLLYVVRATEQQFQTGWFIESLLTELVIALVVRTRLPFYRSRPGKLLWIVTLVVGIATLAIPYLPLGSLFGFTPLPAWVLLSLIAMTGLYVMAAEIAKKFFYAHAK